MGMNKHSSARRMSSVLHEEELMPLCETYSASQVCAEKKSETSGLDPQILRASHCPVPKNSPCTSQVANSLRMIDFVARTKSITDCTPFILKMPCVLRSPFLSPQRH
jgi:hypothetical protein